MQLNKLTTIIILFLYSHGLMAESIEFKDFQKNYYAGEKITFSFGPEVVMLTAQTKKVSIKLTTLNRTVFHRSVTTGDLKKPFAFTFPKIKDGVKVGAELELTFLAGNGRVISSQKVELTFYSRNQTVGITKQLKGLKIGVYGENYEIDSFLTKNFIPHTRIDELDIFRGKWLICSGIELNEDNYRQLRALQSRGISVLLLSPLSGEIPLLKMKNDQSQLFMAGKDHINYFGKSLKPLEAKQGFDLIPYGEGSGLKVNESGQWSYIEMTNRIKKSKLIFCSWQLEIDNPNSALWILNLIKNKK